MKALAVRSGWMGLGQGQFVAQDLDQARYRDNAIGSPNETGQNLACRILISSGNL